MSANAELLRLPLLEADGLSVTVAGVPLLRDAAFVLGRGELVVLVGASGTGKTVLLKLIAGIARPGQRGVEAAGRLTFEGQDLLKQRPGGGRIGILFQDHALFDEWTAAGNVRFARDHAARGRQGLPDPRALLEDLGIRPGARPRTMSGGQLQRLALARTLALAPELILYDEPTTGLDVRNAERAAALIQETHREQGCTSLVVTHDVATLAPIADRVLLLDPATGTIEPVAKSEVEQALRDLAPAPAVDPVAAPAPARRYATVRFLEATSDALQSVATVGAHLLPLYPRWRHGLRSLRHSLALTGSVGAFAYVGVAGLILGYVSTFFTFDHLPKRGFTEPLFIDDILRALGYLTWRVLAPVLCTLLIAARTGAAISSDIGNKVYARQFDALRSFGVHPSRYHLTSTLWAMLISAPLLYGLSFLAARSASLALFIYGHPEQSWFFWDQNYHRSLRLPDAFWWRGSGWVLLKVELCALGTGAIAWFMGAQEKMAASDVSRAVTRTIILASLFVLGVHFAMAFVEF